MEKQTVSLKQCIAEATGKQIAMDGKDFIYLDDKTKISYSAISEGNALLLKKSKDNIVNEIGKQCETAIISGFPSQALGSEHFYQSDRDDQINLMGLVTAGNDDLLKCGLKNDDETITWEWKPHTKEQLKAVFDDGAAYKKEQLIKSATLKAQISAATTVEELDLIVW